MLKIENLRKEYPDCTPLKDINVEVHAQDVIAIIGPSGTGKSTLLRLINRLEKPTSGKIYWHGKLVGSKTTSLAEFRQKVGMVFQSFNLFANLTVLENICAAPMDLLHLSQNAAEAKAMALLAKVGLAEKKDSYPEELSGGQKQRVAIARALAMEPEILMLDEPTSALDPSMVHEIVHLIKDLANQGMTMLIVTHDMELARTACNRILYLDEGIVYEDGSPEQIFSHPLHEKTHAFIADS